LVRPLQKQKRDGTLYLRRPEVDAEISLLEAESIATLEMRCSISSKDSAGYISIEALLYFVRTTNSERFNLVLLSELLKRFQRLLPRADHTGDTSKALTKTFIREAVNDRFTEELLLDQKSYNEKLDYYEVNFNHAISMDKRDAEAKYWSSENRQATLQDDSGEGEAFDEFNESDDCYEPLEADLIDKINYRRRLEGAIEQLPIDQQRVIEMWLQDIPADSKDKSAVTMSKVLGVSEKTARTYLKSAFANLRKKLEFPGSNK